MKFDVIVQCECGVKYVDDSIIADTPEQAERHSLIQEGVYHGQLLWNHQPIPPGHTPKSAQAVEVREPVELDS